MSKHPSCWLKLNTDVAVARSSGRAIGGGLFRDVGGGWLKGFITSLGKRSILNAERLAILEGVRLTHQWSFHWLIVKSDNLNAINMLLDK